MSLTDEEYTAKGRELILKVATLFDEAQPDAELAISVASAVFLGTCAVHNLPPQEVLDAAIFMLELTE